MAVVIAALLPVFLLIVLGFILKHSLMPLDTLSAGPAKCYRATVETKERAVRGAYHAD